MREIKFRLIKDGKVVGYEWHILNRQCGDNRLNVICIQHNRTGEEYDSTKKGSGWWCIWYDKNYFIEHDDKEQYTGLCDKHGKEIYGGDVCKVLFGEQELIYTCSWYAEIAAWVFRGNGEWLMWEDIYETCEIIGNIHSDPKLLEQE